MDEIFRSRCSSGNIINCNVCECFSAPGDLKCFSRPADGGNNVTCTLTATGAVLNTVDGDGNPDNNYAGVYYVNSSLTGMLVDDVDALSFRYVVKVQLVGLHDSLSL